MTRAKILASAALAAAALAGCEARQGGVAVAGLCPDWKATPVVAADPAAPVDNCTKRWAYVLAGGKDDAATVADAVVGACEGTLSRWNQANLSAPEAPDALSIITGQPTNPQAEHYSFAQSRALFYVVQARAGRCPAPEVKDGVPAGVAPTV